MAVTSLPADASLLPAVVGRLLCGEFHRVEVSALSSPTSTLESAYSSGPLNLNAE